MSERLSEAEGLCFCISRRQIKKDRVRPWAAASLSDDKDPEPLEARRAEASGGPTGGRTNVRSISACSAGKLEILIPMTIEEATFCGGFSLGGWVGIGE